MKWARKYLSSSSSKTDEPQGKAARSAIGPCSATGQPRRPHVLAKPIDPKVLLAAVLGVPRLNRLNGCILWSKSMTLTYSISGCRYARHPRKRHDSRPGTAESGDASRHETSMPLVDAPTWRTLLGCAYLLRMTTH